MAAKQRACLGGGALWALAVRRHKRLLQVESLLDDQPGRSLWWSQSATTYKSSSSPGSRKGTSGRAPELLCQGLEAACGVLSGLQVLHQLLQNRPGPEGHL